MSCCSALDPLYRGQVHTREAQECCVVLGSHELENGHLWLEVSRGVIHRVLEKRCVRDGSDTLEWEERGALRRGGKRAVS